MKKSILALAVILAFSLAAVAQSSYGGSSSQSQSSAQPSSSAQSSTAQSSDMDKTKTSTGKEKGITGCLEQGTAPGSYVIKDKKHPEGVQVSYSGSEDLSKHVGHKVHATGTMSGDTLNATNVKHISETCNVSGGGEASTGRHHHGAEAGATGNPSTETGTNPSSGAQQPPK